MTNGWIKIDREIADHWIFQDAEKFKWWFDLLLMANWEERKVMHDSHLFTLKRGQMIASISFLCERWNISKPTLIKFLKLLQDECMITREILYRQTPIITICNYDKYQCNVDTIVDTQIDPLIDTQVDTIVDTNKEYKESKERKNIINHPSDDMSSEDDPPRTEPKTTIEDEIKNYWNLMVDETNCGIKKIQIIQGKRKEILGGRLKQYSIEQIKLAIDKTMRSSFMNGQNSRGWIATFDWFIKPNNFPKVLEGNYDNETRQQTQKVTLTPSTSNGNYLTTDDRRRIDKARRDAEFIELMQELAATNKPASEDPRIKYLSP